MQPYLFPYLGYYQLIGRVDCFILLDDVQFIERGYIHRNSILLQGRAHRFTLPVVKGPRSRQIREVPLALTPAWCDDFLATLRHAYHRAPSYAEVQPLVADLLHRGDTSLVSLIDGALAVTCDYLGLPVPTSRSSLDFPSNGVHGADRILAVCTAAGATDYVNPPGGRSLYDPATFSAAGVRCWFLEPSLAPYHQGGTEFVPSLSIIDVMMWNSRADAQALVRQGALTP